MNKTKLSLCIPIYVCIIMIAFFSSETFAQNGAKSKQHNSRYTIEQEDTLSNVEDNYNSVDQWMFDLGRLIGSKNNPQSRIYKVVDLLLPEENNEDIILSLSKKGEIENVKWMQNNQLEMEDDWGITLSRSTSENGYHSFTFDLSFTSYGIGGGEIDCEEALELTYYLPAQGYESALLEKNNCAYSTGSSVYELHFPGKRICWAVIEYSSGSRQGGTGISFYLNKERALSDTIRK